MLRLPSMGLINSLSKLVCLHWTYSTTVTTSHFSSPSCKGQRLSETSTRNLYKCFNGVICLSCACYFIYITEVLKALHHHGSEL